MGPGGSISFLLTIIGRDGRLISECLPFRIARAGYVHVHVPVLSAGAELAAMAGAHGSRTGGGIASNGGASRL